MSHAILDPSAVDRAADSPRSSHADVLGDRLWQAGAVGVLAGLLNQVGGLPSVLKLVLLLAFVGLAPGAATLVWWRGLTPYARGGLTPVLGLSVVVLITSAAATNQWWHPSTVVWLLVLASALSLGAALLVRRSPERPVDRPAGDATDPTLPPVSEADAESSIWSWGAAKLSLLVLAAAVVAWVLCLPTVGRSPASAYGLLAAASPALVVSLVLVIAAALVALRHRSATGLIAAAVVMTAVQRLTVSLATEVPMYSWTYKHIAVVDYIDRFHFVVRGTDIYHNWPGLFTFTAWTDELTGVSPMAIAHWFTPVYHLAMMPLVYVAARAWRRTPLVSAATVFVFEAASFIAQDYFSPQALGYLLALGVVLGLGEMAHRRAAAIPVIVVFAAVTVTHQLTPFWLILVAAGLVVFRRVKPWWLPVVFAAMALSFVYFNYAVVKRYGVVSSTDPIANIKLTQRATPLFGFQTAFFGTITCYLIMFGTVGIVLLVRLISRRTHREWRAPAVLALSPVLLLAVQGYGGEAIFRVFLYSLPGLAPVFATVLVRAVHARLRVAAPMAALMVLLCLASAQSYLGVYSAYRVERSQVLMWQTFNREAPVGSFVYALGPGYPGNWEWYYAARAQRSSSYGRTFYSSSTKVESNLASDAQYAEFMALLDEAIAGRTAPIYFTVSDAEQDYAEINGVLPPDANENLRRHLAADPRWRLVRDLGSTALFRLAAR